MILFQTLANLASVSRCIVLLSLLLKLHSQPHSARPYSHSNRNAHSNLHAHSTPTPPLPPAPPTPPAPPVPPPHPNGPPPDLPPLPLPPVKLGQGLGQANDSYCAYLSAITLSHGYLLHNRTHDFCRLLTMNTSSSDVAGVLSNTSTKDVSPPLVHYVRAVHSHHRSILMLRARSGLGQSVYAKFLSTRYFGKIFVLSKRHAPLHLNATWPFSSLAAPLDWYLSPLAHVWTQLPLDRVKLQLLSREAAHNANTTDTADNGLPIVRAELHFNASGSTSRLDWFHPDRLVHTWPWRLDSVRRHATNWTYFSVHGDATQRRHFLATTGGGLGVGTGTEIAGNNTGCGNDVLDLATSPQDLGLIAISEGFDEPSRGRRNINATGGSTTNGDTTVKRNCSGRVPTPRFLYAFNKESQGLGYFLYHGRFADYLQISVTLRSQYELFLRKDLAG